jgi:long-chain acyl-CoA synthetase
MQPAQLPAKISDIQTPATGLAQDFRSEQNYFAELQSLAGLWQIAAQHYADVVALDAPHETPTVKLTFKELYQQMQQCGAGLQALGVQAGDRISLFADNSPRWLVADQGSMMAGAVNVVRSSQAEASELIFILTNSGSTVLIVEDLTTLKKLLPNLPGLGLRAIILLSDQVADSSIVAGLSAEIKFLNFPQLAQLGHSLTPVSRQASDLATLIYTSGTTGQPKGVMLTHGNLLHQLNAFRAVLQPKPGDKILSILPTWHSYERTCEYFLLSQGCSQTYSSLRHIKQDLKQVQPDFMVAVPRLWESVYEGVQRQLRDQPEKKQKLVNFFFDASHTFIQARRKAQGLSLEHSQLSGGAKLLAQVQALLYAPLHALGEKIVYNKIRQATGGKLQQVISGGGSLAKHLEEFYEIIGVEILVGYGLTETAPVLTVRRPWENLRGSAGKPIPYTQIRIVDPETKTILPLGSRGLVLAKGPQIMAGYYDNPTATAKVLTPEGWFDTGDLGMITDRQDLVLTGRQKDTIVLTNGENIEPQPIEDACLRSVYVEQIMLVGQDQKSLGALIIPNLTNLQTWASSQNYHLVLPAEAALPDPQLASPGSQPLELTDKLVQELYKRELSREVQNRAGYRPDDRVAQFRFVLTPFSVENGLMTQTLKVRRNVVMERYRDMINGMFDAN